MREDRKSRGEGKKKITTYFFLHTPLSSSDCSVMKTTAIYRDTAVFKYKYVRKKRKYWLLIGTAMTYFSLSKQREKYPSRGGKKISKRRNERIMYQSFTLWTLGHHREYKATQLADYISALGKIYMRSYQGCKIHMKKKAYHTLRLDRSTGFFLIFARHWLYSIQFTLFLRLQPGWSSCLWNLFGILLQIMTHTHSACTRKRGCSLAWEPIFR